MGFVAEPDRLTWADVVKRSESMLHRIEQARADAVQAEADEHVCCNHGDEPPPPLRAKSSRVVRARIVAWSKVPPIVDLPDYAMETEVEYDSTADTLKHSRRVGELISQPIKELIDRSVTHDLSKTQPPEVEVFNEFTPKLKDSTYGSDEYKGFLAAMGEGLKHHYANNRHHPEHHAEGIDGMTLVDLMEMLADWKAATERHTDGSLVRSLDHQKTRFAISDQLNKILWNTARSFGWLDRAECGDTWTAPDGTRMECNVAVTRPEGHSGLHADGRWHGGQLTW